MEADPAERRQILENMRRWQQMTPEQREEMRQKFKEMRRQRKLDRRQERQEKRQERRKGGG
jgi:TRAP-type C4-dicarboxylate transport system substrate-binding protein